MDYTHSQMVDLSGRSKENQHWMQNNMVNKLDNRMKTFKGIEVWGTMVKVRMVHII